MVKKGFFLKGYYFLKLLMLYFEDRLNFICILSSVKEFDKYIVCYERKVNSNNFYLIYQFIKGKEFVVNVIVVNGCF